MVELTLKSRLFIYHKMFHSIENYFAHWKNIKGLNVNELYSSYSEKIIKTSDRYQFGLLMKEVLSRLENGHTGYWDGEFNKNYAYPMGFHAFYHEREKKWVISSTRNEEIRVGDVITEIGKVKTSEFFKLKSKYISASSERQKRNALFKDMWLFPVNFDIKINDNKIVSIRRNSKVKVKDSKLETRIMDDKIIYINIPSFCNPYNTGIASKFVNRFKDHKSIIIDIRNNVGGSTPANFIGLLMNKKYKRLNYDTIFQRNALELMYNRKGNNDYKYRHHIAKYHNPMNTAFKGNIIILVNENTVSAAEDFLYPFKNNGRAKIIGTTTSGSTGDSYSYVFPDRIGIYIGAVAACFEDGSKFEGIGIKPDKEVYPSIKDIKEGKDIVLETAIKSLKST
jgi:carboxyl-terminal processing protease